MTSGGDDEADEQSDPPDRGTAHQSRSSKRRIWMNERIARITSSR